MTLRISIIIIVGLCSMTTGYVQKSHSGGGGQQGVRVYRQGDLVEAEGVKTPEQEMTPIPTTHQSKVPDCSGTCQFTNPAATQFLVSCDGSCVCVTRTGVIDAASWNVIWNGTICTMSESGPCGRGEGGMVMACQPGLECIEKRCREPSRVGSLEGGWACDDSYDCQSGLACVSDENTFPIHKTCRALPKSLFRIW